MTEQQQQLALPSSPAFSHHDGDQPMQTANEVPGTPDTDGAERQGTHQLAPIPGGTTPSTPVAQTGQFPRADFGSANDGSPTPTRQPRPSRSMSFMLDPEDPKLHNPLTTEEDKKDLIQAFRAQVQAKEQPKNEGAITFPKYGYPRCISARSLWPAYLGSDETVLILDSAKKREHVFIWATAYKTMEITNRELELFTTGLAMYEALESGKGFKAGEYRLVPPPTSSKGFIILALDLDAAKRLLSKRVITVRSPTKATTFFLQTEKSWGSHIIFDVANGGRNFEKDVLPRIYRACKEGILHDTTTKPGHATFNDLAYYQVPWNPKTHKGAKGLIWRVRFKYTLAAMEPTWMLPRHLGSGNRGVIEWWREGLVAGSKTAPKDPVEAEWKVIESHPLKKLE